MIGFLARYNCDSCLIFLYNLKTILGMEIRTCGKINKTSFLELIKI